MLHQFGGALNIILQPYWLQQACVGVSEGSKKLTRSFFACVELEAGTHNTS